MCGQIIVQAQSDLLQVVFALRTPSGFAGLLDSGQQEGDEDRDDRDDDEQFDQCERPAGSCSCHVNTPVIRGFVYAIRSAAGFSAGHCLDQADPADERGGRRLQAEGFFSGALYAQFGNTHAGAAGRSECDCCRGAVKVEIRLNCGVLSFLGMSLLCRVVA